jgi:hypothetical protein
MRNYIMFFYLVGNIEERLANGNLVGTFTNEFIGGTKDELYENFTLYAQAFQGTHRYTLLNLDDAAKCYMELNKKQLNKMFALMSTLFDQVVSTWAPVEPSFGDFAGTIPRSAFFTDRRPLFVFESPRKTWSHGE